MTVLLSLMLIVLVFLEIRLQSKLNQTAAAGDIIRQSAIAVLMLILAVGILLIIRQLLASFM